MAVKKTSKKTAKKAARKPAAKKAAPTSKKAKSSASQGRLDGIRRTSKKLVDQMLVKVSPQLQDKIDNLIKTLESSRDGRIADLSLLAGKILIRAQNISHGLRTSRTGGKKR